MAEQEELAGIVIRAVGVKRYYGQEGQAALKYLPLWAAHVEDKEPFGVDDVLAVYRWMST